MRIMLRHLLPNCFPPIIVLMTMQMGTMRPGDGFATFVGPLGQPTEARRAWEAAASDAVSLLTDEGPLVKEAATRKLAEFKGGVVRD